MFLRKMNGPRSVELPDGTHMSRADLPPANTQRWVASRKAAVIKGVAAGLISADEACETYGLSAEELDSWRRLAAHHGEKGLKTTRLQNFRNNNDN
ncbi:MAG: CtrA inhibitor SciP [Planktomarina sp.]